METVVSKWHISDYDGRRNGSPIVIGMEDVYDCKGLTEWKRVKGFLFRWKELLFFLDIGLDKSVICSYTISDWAIIAKEINNALNGRHIIEVLLEMQLFFNVDYNVNLYYKYRMDNRM